MLFLSFHIVIFNLFSLLIISLFTVGGAVDGGESLTHAAVRETIEEAGIEVNLKGILSIEYHADKSRSSHNSSSSQAWAKMRVIFYAEPSSKGIHQLPKSSPDFESAGASWCSLDDIEYNIKLRGNEPKKWSRFCA
jgi:8-oxo-dGTP pyrophosphatase MutT (NUDIX family)